MTKRPLIGVLPLFDAERNSIWMLPGYMDAIEEAGGIPMILPLTDDREVLNTMLDIYDGFLFTGGQDVDPRVYGKEILSFCGEICPVRDRMETYLIERIIEADKPLLGICRGLQILNAALGGTLYQDIERQAERILDIQHKQCFSTEESVHSVTLQRDSFLYECLGQEKINVNSLHHQAIKRLAPSLTAFAISYDGLVEGVQMEQASFIAAVQWHPELNFRKDENSRKLFRYFIEKCME